MGDRQRWMFPPPPAPGSDPEYDALIRAHHEAEDANDERRIELAMAILLISRNYSPTPREYQEIFNFGADESARFAAQSAIADIVHDGLDHCRINRSPVRARSTTPILHTHFRSVKTSVRSYAGRVCSTVAPWLKQPSSRP